MDAFKHISQYVAGKTKNQYFNCPCCGIHKNAKVYYRRATRRVMKQINKKVAEEELGDNQNEPC